MTGRVRVDGPPLSGVTETRPLVPRADFRVRDFFAMVDNHGARLAWARATKCPCKPVNRQTDQPDPRCARCKGTGWAYFGPAHYTPSDALGELDELQKALLAQYGASGIRGVLYGMSRQDQAYGKIGPWAFGHGQVTVRPENVIAYHDRLVDLDSEMAFTQVIETEWSVGRDPVPLPISTKYLVVGLNYASTLDGPRFVLGADIVLSPRGELTWKPGKAPPAGTRVTYHYLSHAHWRVNEAPHLMRRTQTKNRIKHPRTPLGDPTALPLQAAVLLEAETEEPKP